MSLHRGLLNWGVFLIVLAALPLAARLGYFDAGAAGQVLRLWPLILVAIGVGVILRLTSFSALGGVLVAATFGLLGGALIVGGVGSIGGACVGNAQAAGLETRSGDFTGEQADVRLELTCVDVLVQRHAGSGWTVAADFTNDDPRLDATPDGLSLTSTPGRSIFPAGRQRRAINVDLPQDQALDVSLTLNAARATVRLPGEISSFSGTFNAADVSLELGGASQGSSLNLTFNAASGRLTLPPATLSGGITLNAASLELCAAADAGLRIDDRATVSANNFAEAGLERVGDSWQTPGYATAEIQTQLRVSANAASINLHRTGGCP